MNGSNEISMISFSYNVENECINSLQKIILDACDNQI